MMATTPNTQQRQRIQTTCDLMAMRIAKKGTTVLSAEQIGCGGRNYYDQPVDPSYRLHLSNGLDLIVEDIYCGEARIEGGASRTHVICDIGWDSRTDGWHDKITVRLANLSAREQAWIAAGIALAAPLADGDDGEYLA